MSDTILITDNNQYQFRGLLMGTGTPYMIETWEGLIGIPDINSQDLERKDDHGTVPGPDIMGNRTLEGTVHLLDSSGPTSTFQKVMVWQNAMRPGQQEVPFYYKLPGLPLRYVMARPRKSDMPKDYDLARGHGNITVQLVASKPWHYDVATNSSVYTMSGDERYHDFANLYNVGNWWSAPTVTMVGPAVSPRLTMTSQTGLDGVNNTGNSITLTGLTLDVADTLEVDFRKRTITKNGVSVYGLKSLDSRWWMMSPLANTIRVARYQDGYTGSVNPGGTATTVTWTNTHLY